MLFRSRSALVDAGGDLAIGEPPPGRSGWLVSLPDGDTIRLARAAVATSGDRERHVVIDGVRYGHIVDPATGLGRTDTPSVTVIAPTATRADALASALSILERTRGEALVRQLSGTWARVDGPRSWTASGPELAAPVIYHHFEKDPS